jgi:hypothetical protein
LRDYIDRISEDTSKGARQRSRHHDDEHKSTVNAPLMAPLWTLAGYNGYLKKCVEDACDSLDLEVQIYTQDEKGSSSSSSSDDNIGQDKSKKYK